MSQMGQRDVRLCPTKVTSRSFTPARILWWDRGERPLVPLYSVFNYRTRFANAGVL